MTAPTPAPGSTPSLSVPVERVLYALTEYSAAVSRLENKNTKKTRTAADKALFLLGVEHDKLRRAASVIFPHEPEGLSENERISYDARCRAVSALDEPYLRCSFIRCGTQWEIRKWETGYNEGGYEVNRKPYMAADAEWVLFGRYPDPVTVMRAIYAEGGE